MCVCGEFSCVVITAYTVIFKNNVLYIICTVFGVKYSYISEGLYLKKGLVCDFIYPDLHTTIWYFYLITYGLTLKKNMRGTLNSLQRSLHLSLL